MSTSERGTNWRWAISVLWFPVVFAILLPVTFQVAFHRPTPHKVPIVVVGNSGEVSRVADLLHRSVPGGFVVRRSPSAAAATVAVRRRRVAAAYLAGASPTSLYVARAASAIRANDLQAVFARVATETHTQPPRIVDVVPVASGDGGTAIFFFVFPLMMIALIAAIVVLQLPTWGIGRRVAVVAVVGAIGALATYLTAIGLHVLPGKALLLVYAFVLTQVYGQLMVGAAPLLKQYFLPFSLTLALILSVPSSGGTVTPDLLPAFFRDLSYVMPLAQGVTVTRGVAYFQNSGIAQATLMLALWAAIAGAVVAFARLRQSYVETARAGVAAEQSHPSPSLAAHIESGRQSGSWHP
jgi:hypothetical protein